MDNDSNFDEDNFFTSYVEAIMRQRHQILEQFCAAFYIAERLEKGEKISLDDLQLVEERKDEKIIWYLENKNRSSSEN